MARAMAGGLFLSLKAAAMLVALAGIAGAASAQIAPPPGPAPAEQPVVVPPVPPRLAPPITQNNNNQPARQPTAEEEVRRRLEAQGQQLPDLPFESLVVRDDAGRVVPVTQNPHELALARNPLMDDSSVERCQGVIAERRARMEQKVIDNIDLVQQVLDGVIDRAVITDQASVAAVVAVVRPFQEMGHLTEDLKAQNVLTDLQYLFNWKIVREYEQAMQNQIMTDAATNAGGEHPGTYMTRQIMGDFLREPMAAYDALLVEGSTRMDQVMAGITIAPDKGADAARFRADAEGATTDADRIAAMRSLTGLLDAPQKGQFLRNVIDTR